MDCVSKIIRFENSKNENAERKHILLCGDKNYIKYCGITLTSVLISNPDENFTFHIFCDDITKEDLEKIKITTEKFNIDINVYYLNANLLKMFSTDMHGNDHISIAAYFRFIAFGELYKYIDKVLYLDSDILVRNNINVFWEKEMNSKCAIVVEDAAGKDNARRLKTNKYFNSGVMFVDLKTWKIKEYTKKCMEEATKKVYRFLDQDILNLVLDNDILCIDKKYNFNYSLSRLMDKSKKPSSEELSGNVVVCHFIGASKPWHSWVQCFKAVKEYNDIKEHSEWNDNSIITPFDMKKDKYKYMHKFARLSKKESNYQEMCYWYFQYAINKILK